MKRYALIICAAMGVVLSSGVARADCSTLTYSGYQPWWNIFAHHPRCTTPEEARLQHFWHDYYAALKHYYGAPAPDQRRRLWGNGCRINYAPVFVAPTRQWAVPNSCVGGPPAMNGGY